MSEEEIVSEENQDEESDQNVQQLFQTMELPSASLDKKS